VPPYKTTRRLPDGAAIHITATTGRGYFSATADIPALGSCGCLHEDILAVALK